MAREWQPASSCDVMPPKTGFSSGERAVRSRSVARNWSATRGAVIWEGPVDLGGSFPGFAHWGSRAPAVHLTLTDHFLLVDEPTDYGFGLPIGWLSAAQALTGVEPIAAGGGDLIRVGYLDGDRVRGFTLRVRGGRFGNRSGRRAAQFRAAAMSLGLASATPVTDLLLPPEHDLSLDWDDFPSYENEPVIWSGRTSMPVGSGLESVVCDVWLTSASLIWGASSRAGIYRIATDSLAGITTADSPAHEPVIYWTVGGSHQTHVDLPMVFPRPDRSHREAASRDALVEILGGLGHRIELPASPPQPWLAPVEVLRAPEPCSPALDSDRADRSADGSGDETPAETADQSHPSRRHLMDDGLFPERLPPSFPRSTPLPWGQLVERIEEGAGPVVLPSIRTAPEPASPDQPASAHEPVLDRPRIWPPAASRRQSQPAGQDAAAMLVHRPRVRATTTEEFLASEQAARAAALAAEREPTDSGPALVSERSVIVRFRRRGGVIAEPGGKASLEADSIDRATVKVQPVVEVDDSGPGGEDLAQVSGDDVADGTMHVPGSAFGQPADVPSHQAAATMAVPERAYPALPARAGTQGPVDAAEPSHLRRMRLAQSGIDTQLERAIVALSRLDTGTDRPVVNATAPFLTEAIDALRSAVDCGEISPRAAETQRAAITRSADTTERIRSLLDLHARGYLTRTDLETRREVLLDRSGTTDHG